MQEGALENSEIRFWVVTRVEKVEKKTSGFSRSPRIRDEVGKYSVPEDQ